MNPLTTNDTVVSALRMFPDSIIDPNHGCAYCNACRLITRLNGLPVITVHHPNCPTRVEL
jgi:hypothetical protein